HGRPHRSASDAQATRSAPGRDADTAVTASVRSGPRVSSATQASSAESTPPEKAITTEPSSRRRSRSASRSTVGVATAASAIEDLDPDPLVALALRLGLDHPHPADLAG